MKYGCNILIDQNLVSFDLGEPLDAYRLAISLHRIHLAQDEHLKKLLTTKHINNLLKQIENGTVPTWTVNKLYGAETGHGRYAASVFSVPLTVVLTHCLRLQHCAAH